MLNAPVVWAQEGEARSVRARAALVAGEVDAAQFVRRQAELEARVGIALYAVEDDYRAVGALDRWRIMAAEPSVSFRAELMVGHIYHRNKKPGLAALRFEQAAAAAPDEARRGWALALAAQQLCLPLGLDALCVRQLGALEPLAADGSLAELLVYQRAYARFWASGEVWTERAAGELDDEVLRAQGRALIEAQRAYLEQDTQSPWLAAGLSAVLPGAGQAYNGRWADAAVSLGLNGGLGAATYYAFTRSESRAPGIALAILLAGFYTGNVVNAYSDAGRINAQREAEARAKMAGALWPRVRFEIDGEAVRFGYRFDWR
jgi:hypothetical protein